MSAWVIGALVSVLGLVGLVLAGHALDAGMYHFGFALFAFAVFFAFWLIKTHFDRLLVGAPSDGRELPTAPASGLE